MGDPVASTLLRFAEVAESIAATRSKLDKARLLAEYLRLLDRERLPIATRWFTGRVFPAWDGLVLQVGGAALSAALRAVTGADASALGAAWSRHADIGDATHELFTQAARAGCCGVDVLDVQGQLSMIAATSGTRRKTELLQSLLERCAPLEAKYLTKIMTSELRIGLRDGLVEDAMARAFERAPGAVQRADMVIGDLGEVALLAQADRLAEAAPRLFAPLRFMLASPVADAEEVVRRLGDEVWVEDKYDGIRCQLHRGPGRIALYSRDLNEVSTQFPEVVAAAQALPTGLVLDGELLAFRDGGVLPFQSLQTRLGRKQPSPAVLEQAPVIMVCWDVLIQDGVSLLDEGLRERRARLEALAMPEGLGLAHLERARGAAALERLFLDARARLNEGLMAKDPDSPYLPGRRGLHWLKLKKPLDTLDVVVIGAEYGHGRRRAVLSDVTFGVRTDDSDDLVPIGKAYTGLTDVEIATMTALLESITLDQHGRYRTVRPQIVLEVAFDRIQPSQRHRSGYALRFPRIVRWRHDKAVADIDLLSRVAEISDAGHGVAQQRVDEGGDG